MRIFKLTRVLSAVAVLLSVGFMASVAHASQFVMINVLGDSGAPKSINCITLHKVTSPSSPSLFQACISASDAQYFVNALRLQSVFNLNFDLKEVRNPASPTITNELQTAHLQNARVIKITPIRRSANDMHEYDEVDFVFQKITYTSPEASTSTVDDWNAPTN